MHKNNCFKPKFLSILFPLSVLMLACNQTEQRKSHPGHSAEKNFYPGKGSGPVKNIVLSDINAALARDGEKIFNEKCVACHRITDEKLIGPGLRGVTRRRTAEWIMNQILDPLGMTSTDSLSRELLSVYLTQMTPMELSEQQARSVLEYFRMNDF